MNAGVAFLSFGSVWISALNNIWVNNPLNSRYIRFERHVMRYPGRGYGMELNEDFLRTNPYFNYLFIFVTITLNR
jgi:hypothetical protein